MIDDRGSVGVSSPAQVTAKSPAGRREPSGLAETPSNGSSRRPTSNAYFVHIAKEKKRSIKARVVSEGPLEQLDELSGHRWFLNCTEAAAGTLGLESGLVDIDDDGFIRLEKAGRQDWPELMEGLLGTLEKVDVQAWSEHDNFERIGFKHS